MKIYRRMLSYLRPYIWRLALAGLFMVGFALLNGAVAFLVKPVLDDVFIGKDPDRLVLIPLVILVVYLAKGACEFAQSYFMSHVGQRVVLDIRNNLYRHMQLLSMSFFSRNPTGTLIARILNDVGVMQGAITQAATGLVKDSCTAVFLATVVFWRDWKLAFVALVVFPLAVWPIIRFGRKLRRASTKSQEIVGALTEHLHETLSGAKLVKSFNAEEYETNRFAVRNDDLFRLGMKMVRVHAVTAPLSEVVGGIGIAAVTYYGGYSVVKGYSTPGNFFSFMTALLMLYRPIKSLSSLNNTIQQGIAGAERVFSVIDTLPEIQDRPGAVELKEIQEGVSFENVSFQYIENGPTVLKGITLDVPRGTMVALVGSSGAGKTTIVDMIPRFYDPQEGAVRIDGKDIRDYSVVSLRERIGIVGQHTTLFNDTIFNNITYGKRGATLAQVEEASRCAGAHGFISKMKDGYESVIGEQGLRLSGGERQRIAIARALLRDAPILILDEATSALDTVSERIVQEALDRLMQGRTTFVIAHRLSTVRNADVIIVVENGQIVEKGKHEELMAWDSSYRNVYLKQFEGRKSVSAVNAD